jgi:hypothetical protein
MHICSWSRGWSCCILCFLLLRLETKTILSDVLAALLIDPDASSADKLSLVFLLDGKRRARSSCFCRMARSKARCSALSSARLAAAAAAKASWRCSSVSPSNKEGSIKDEALSLIFKQKSC